MGISEQSKIVTVLLGAFRRTYDAIVFDVDGVLLRPPARPDSTRDAIEAAFSAYDVKPSESDLELFYGGTGGTAERIGRVCDRYGLELADFWSDLEHHVSELQRRLIEHGERDLYDDHVALSTLADTADLDLVSNNIHASIEFVVDYFGLDDHVETVDGREPTVEGYRRRMPNPHYIERALDDLGTRGALYVGDSASDVVGARRAQLDSAIVRRDHGTTNDLPDEPTHEIGRLTALTDLI